MKRIGQLAIVCTAVLTLACDMDRRNESVNDEPGTVGTTGVSAGDRDFVEESLSAGMAEVELGRMAQQKASSAEVKQFAEMMVRDHSKSGEELKQIAQQHSIPAPTQIEEQHRDVMNRLSNLKGADFDREYMDAMVDNHQNMVDHLQTRASEDRFGENKGAVQPEGSDSPVEASVNQWAANALPTTRHHLDEARRVNDIVNNRAATTRQY